MNEPSLLLDRGFANAVIGGPKCVISRAEHAAAPQRCDQRRTCDERSLQLRKNMFIVSTTGSPPDIERSREQQRARCEAVRSGVDNRRPARLIGASCAALHSPSLC
jgi:hypothetical protein